MFLRPFKKDVNFTERIETLHFLEERLDKDLGLTDGQVSVIHGQGESDVEIQARVEAFGRDQAPVRLLIATDIAAEGINLRYLCHKRRRKTSAIARRFKFNCVRTQLIKRPWLQSGSHPGACFADAVHDGLDNTERASLAYTCGINASYQYHVS